MKNENKNMHWQSLEEYLNSIFDELDDILEEVENSLSPDLVEILEQEIAVAKIRLSMVAKTINQDVGYVSLKKEGPALFARMNSALGQRKKCPQNLNRPVYE